MTWVSPKLYIGTKRLLTDLIATRTNTVN